MKPASTMAIALCVTAALTGCGKSDGQLERERKEAARQEAIAESLAEEREKDRQMREAATLAAEEEFARSAGDAGEERVERPAASVPPPPANPPAGSDELLRRYTERLRTSVGDPGTMQVRNAIIAPKQNGMCAEFSARDKSGAYAGFKRVIVTDGTVDPEEPPLKEMLPKFLAFQASARATGCFPEVLNDRVLR